MRFSLTPLLFAALAACGPRPYRSVPLPITREKLPVRIEADFTPPARILTLEGVAGSPYLEDVAVLLGDVTELRGDTMVVSYVAVGHPSGVVLTRSGTAFVPMASVTRMNSVRHIPSVSELNHWETQKTIWGTLLSLALIALSLWLTIQLNK